MEKHNPEIRILQTIRDNEYHLTLCNPRALGKPPAQTGIGAQWSTDEGKIGPLWRNWLPLWLALLVPWHPASQVSSHWQMEQRLGKRSRVLVISTDL
jgi:hypothetical protein